MQIRTCSARLWLQRLQVWLGKGLSWCSDGAQEPFRSIILGVLVIVAGCWVQDGAQKSVRAIFPLTCHYQNAIKRQKTGGGRAPTNTCLCL